MDVSGDSDPDSGSPRFKGQPALSHKSQREDDGQGFSHWAKNLVIRQENSQWANVLITNNTIVNNTIVSPAVLHVGGVWPLSILDTLKLEERDGHWVQVATKVAAMCLIGMRYDQRVFPQLHWSVASAVKRRGLYGKRNLRQRGHVTLSGDNPTESAPEHPIPKLSTATLCDFVD